jgi:hypothetical protein
MCVLFIAMLKCRKLTDAMAERKGAGRPRTRPLADTHEFKEMERLRIALYRKRKKEGEATPKKGSKVKVKRVNKEKRKEPVVTKECKQAVNKKYIKKKTTTTEAHDERKTEKEIIILDDSEATDTDTDTEERKRANNKKKVSFSATVTTHTDNTTTTETMKGTRTTTHISSTTTSIQHHTSVLKNRSTQTEEDVEVIKRVLDELVAEIEKKENVREKEKEKESTLRAQEKEEKKELKEIDLVLKNIWICDCEQVRIEQIKIREKLNKYLAPCPGLFADASATGYQPWIILRSITEGTRSVCGVAIKIEEAQSRAVSPVDKLYGFRPGHLIYPINIIHEFKNVFLNVEGHQSMQRLIGEPYKTARMQLEKIYTNQKTRKLPKKLEWTNCQLSNIERIECELTAEAIKERAILVKARELIRNKAKKNEVKEP